MVAIMRDYHRTHPWIKFTFDLNKINQDAWLKLGQIQAKCDQISGVPLLPSVAQTLHRVYLAKGALATTAIEGNTLTEEEVMLLLEGKLKLPPSKEYLKKEVENVIDAANWVTERILNNSLNDLNPDDIKTFNQMVQEGLPLKPEIVPGEYRSHDVWVANYKGAPPEDLSILVGEMCEWLNKKMNAPLHLKSAVSILKAIIAHVYIAWIHPFADGNGRTARLVELQVLITDGFPTPTAHLLSNHYNETRSEYYRYLSLASKHEDGIYDFINYALQGFIDNLNEQIKFVEAQQLAVHWESYIHSRFRALGDNKTNNRRRWLVKDLSGKAEPVTLSDMRYVSTRIAEAYAGKTEVTVRRDLNELVKMELVIKTPEGFYANKEIMRAFLAPKRKEQ